MMITAKIENSATGYRGFLLENEKEVAKTSLFGTEKAVRNALNRKIQDFNLMHEADMPLLVERQTLIVYEKGKPDSQAVEGELLSQPPQITGFVQRGEVVTIYFGDGKQCETTANRLFNINKPSGSNA